MNISHELSENTYLVTHDVGPKQNGIRLDAFLKERYKSRTRETLQKAIGAGVVTVERNQGRHMTVGRLKPSTQLVPGDQVLVKTERKPEPDVDFNYKILFEDETLFIIYKPGNLPVHPAGRFFFNTLLTHLKTEGFKNPLKADREYFLVHRIDRETSGVLVLSKDREVCAHLTKQFAQRKTKKRYLAIVYGQPPESFTVDQAMKRKENSLISLKMACYPESEGGYPASTRFQVLERAGDFALVECFPETGRQHQIRVHLEYAGHPIVGDKLYGMPDSESLRWYDRTLLTPEAEARLQHYRHALHATGIEFQHPITGQMVKFDSPLPDDLVALLDRARSGALKSNRL